MKLLLEIHSAYIMPHDSAAVPRTPAIGAITYTISKYMRYTTIIATISTPRTSSKPTPPHKTIYGMSLFLLPKAEKPPESGFRHRPLPFVLNALNDLGKPILCLAGVQHPLQLIQLPIRLSGLHKFIA